MNFLCELTTHLWRQRELQDTAVEPFTAISGHPQARVISSNKLQAATTKGDEHLNIPSSRSNPAAQKRAKPRQPFFSSGGVVRCTSRRQKLRKDQGLQVQNSLEMRIALAQGGKHQPAMGSGHCAGEMSNRMKITDVKTGACRSCMILQTLLRLWLVQVLQGVEASECVRTCLCQPAEALAALMRADHRLVAALGTESSYLTALDCT